ncbi:MAG: hypothetical protein QY318_00890 [Candidatus Dojkabacteria bacterium]|nr:MAG: hypothetical protein QY318_00890 [Candidatus Dojkabacteria bacterium]
MQQTFVVTLRRFAADANLNDGAWSIFAAEDIGATTEGIGATSESQPTIQLFNEILSKSEKWSNAYWNGRNLGNPTGNLASPRVEKNAIHHSESAQFAVNRWGTQERELTVPNWLLNSAFGKRHYKNDQAYQASWLGGISRGLLYTQDRKIEQIPKALLSLLVLTNQARYELDYQFDNIRKSSLGISNPSMLEQLWAPAFYRLGLYETLNESLYRCVAELGGFYPESEVVEYDDGQALGLFFTVGMLKVLEFIDFQPPAIRPKDEGLFKVPPLTKEYTAERNQLFKDIAEVLLNTPDNDEAGPIAGPVNFLAIRDLLKQYVGRYPTVLDIRYWGSIDLSPFDDEFLDHVPEFTGFRTTGSSYEAANAFYKFARSERGAFGVETLAGLSYATMSKRGLMDTPLTYRIASGGIVEIPELQLLIGDTFHGDYHEYTELGKTTWVSKPGLNLEVIAHIPNDSSRAFLSDNPPLERVTMTLSFELLASLLMDGRILLSPKQVSPHPG